MKKGNFQLFILAFIIRIAFSLIVNINALFIGFSFFIFAFYLLMLYKRVKIINYLPLVILDFIAYFYFVSSIYDFSLVSIFTSIGLFVVSNGFLYYLIATKLAKSNSSRYATFLSNLEVDKGISALEKDDYEEATRAFLQAIKEHKKNYLGYMGMCNTLEKMSSYDKKTFAYYKKKCLKYAPKELKESISNKYK